MSDLLKGVLIGVCSTAVVSGIGYVFVIRDHGIKIENIEKDISGLGTSFIGQTVDLKRIGLAVAAEHPNRQLASSGAAEKLKKLDRGEFHTLADGLSNATFVNQEELRAVKNPVSQEDRDKLAVVRKALEEGRLEKEDSVHGWYLRNLLVNTTLPEAKIQQAKPIYSSKLDGSKDEVVVSSSKDFIGLIKKYGFTKTELKKYDDVVEDRDFALEVGKN